MSHLSAADHIDLSAEAFAVLAPNRLGVIYVSYRRVACNLAPAASPAPTDGSYGPLLKGMIGIQVDGGSSNSWLQIRFVNVGGTGTLLRVQAKEASSLPWVGAWGKGQGWTS